MALGTDELEWWDDRESYLKIAALQHSEMSITKVEVRRTVAWKEGGLGWVAGELCLSTADAGDFNLRMTVVYRREGPYWRVIHYHASMPVKAVDMFGYELTTSLDSMLDMAHDESLDFTAGAAGGVSFSCLRISKAQPCCSKPSAKLAGWGFTDGTTRLSANKWPCSGAPSLRAKVTVSW